MIDINKDLTVKNRTTWVLLAALAYSMLFISGCNEDELSDEELKVYTAPDVALDYTPDLAAYYRYSYDDTRWLRASLLEPEKGFYSNTDVPNDIAVIEQHITESKAAGINTWIFNFAEVNITEDVEGKLSYKGPSAIQALNDNVPSFVTDMKYFISYTIKNEINTVSGMARLERQLTEIIDKNTGHENYYTIDGKPVIMIADKLIPPVPESAGTTPDDSRIADLEALRERLETYAGKELYFMLDVMSFNPPKRYHHIIKWADGVTSSNMAPSQANVVGNYYEYNEYAQLTWSDYTQVDSLNTHFIPLIMNGRNDTTSYSVTDKYGEVLDLPSNPSWVFGGTKEFFTTQVKIAKSVIDNDLGLIIVNSFNDWQFGSAVEPSVEMGDAYMEVLKTEL